MDKICYKVVERGNGQDFISTSSCCGNKNSLVYRIGETTYPKIGKIFVFDDCHDATNFFFFFGASGILKGVAKSISYPKYCSEKIIGIEEFWKNKKNKKSVHDVSMNVYNGTVWCNSFTPTEVFFYLPHI